MVFARLAKYVGSIAEGKVDVAREFDAETATGADAATTGLRLGGADASNIKDGDRGE